MGRPLLFLPFLMMTTIACSPGKSTGDWLTIGTEFPLEKLFPSRLSGASSAFNDLVFEGLFLQTPSGYEPCLATSFQVEDGGKRYRVTLKPNVHFHDGRAFTPRDVVFSYGYYGVIREHFLAFLIEFIDRVTAVSREEILFDLRQPLASFPLALTLPILPAPQAWKDGDSFDFTSYQTEIGTGPFRMETGTPSSMAFSANPTYHGEGPYLRGIKVISYPSTAAVWSRIVAGEIDMAPKLADMDIIRLAKIPHISIKTYFFPYSYLLLVHPRSPAAPIISALNQAVNRVEIVRSALSEQGIPLQSLILPKSWAYQSVFHVEFNPEQALRLIKQAGYRDGNGDGILEKEGRSLRITCQVPEGDLMLLETAKLLKRQLFQIGVDLEIRPLPIPQIAVSVYKDFSYEMAFWYGLSFPEPDVIASLGDILFKPYPFYERWRDLTRQARQEMDEKRRTSLYHEAMVLLRDQPPGVFLFWRYNSIPLHRRFQAPEINPFYLLANVHQWYVPASEQKYRDEPDLR